MKTKRRYSITFYNLTFDEVGELIAIREPDEMKIVKPPQARATPTKRPRRPTNDLYIIRLRRPANTRLAPGELEIFNYLVKWQATRNNKPFLRRHFNEYLSGTTTKIPLSSRATYISALINKKYIIKAREEK